MFRKFIVKAAWAVIRRLDKKTYQLYSSALRQQLWDALATTNPRSTPIQSSKYQRDVFSTFMQPEDWPSRYENPVDRFKYGWTEKGLPGKRFVLLDKPTPLFSPIKPATRNELEDEWRTD